jgi:KDO2-lipid IV(A) lauroyltransferase
MTHWLFRQGYPLRWFGERPRNVSEYLLRQFRSAGAHGQEGLFVSRTATPAEAASTVYHAARLLKAGMLLKVACDVRWDDAKAATTAFLGRSESFSTTWVTLAAMTGASVVPAFCRMDERGTFHLDFRPPLTVPRDARRDGRALPWVEHALADLEAEVKRHPEHSNDYFFWEPMIASLPAEEHKRPADTAKHTATVLDREVA